MFTRPFASLHEGGGAVRELVLDSMGVLGEGHFNILRTLKTEKRLL